MRANRSTAWQSLSDQNGACGAGAEAVLSSASGPDALVDGRAVLNFASACYLGIDYGPWLSAEGKAANGLCPFGLGLPRGLAADQDSGCLETQLAVLVERPAVVLARSTLHALMSVVPMLAGPHGLVVSDRLAYPILRMAVERATGLGARSVLTTQDAPQAVAEALATCRQRPAVVLCESLRVPGRLAPLRELARMCSVQQAWLVVDDTQAIGLLGRRDRRAACRYGLGGGGALVHLGVKGPHIVHVASLAKALGVPVAFIASDSCTIQRYLAHAEVVYSSSPPDPLSVRAALFALEVNAQTGDGIRRQLGETVAQFRRRAATHGTRSLPVQSWYFRRSERARFIADELLAAGIWTVPVPAASENPGHAAIRFLLSAAHAGPPLVRALAAIDAVRRRHMPW